MGAVGTADLDFGAFPGKHDVTVAVTGQTAIGAGSRVEAWVQPQVSADHSADEHMVEALVVFARDIVAGTGFTIYGFENFLRAHSEDVTTADNLYGVYKVAWAWI